MNKNEEAQNQKQLGNNAYKNEDYASALKNYEKAIELDPTEITYYLNAAAAQFEMEKFTECVMFCLKGCKIGQENGANPNLIAKGFARMGRAHFNLNNLEMAKLAYEKAQKENKTSECEEMLNGIEAVLELCQMKGVRPSISEFMRLVKEIDEKRLCRLFEIKGKGKGYVALEDIEIGTLIMTERLQCVPILGTSLQQRQLGNFYSLDDYFCSEVNAFFSMCKKDQQDFLKLSNKYWDTDSLRDERKRFYLDMERFAIHEKHRFSDPRCIDTRLILKILCIFNSNIFDTICKGVGIKIARFNHSCCPNAEMSENGFGEMEIRATSKILEGQEISLLYNSHSFILENKKARQSHHLENWGFVCSCERCQDEDINQVDKTSERFHRLIKDAEIYWKKAQKNTSDSKKYLGFIEKAISSYKQLHSLAESKKVPKFFISDEMLKKCFDLEVKRYAFAKKMVFDQGKQKFASKMKYFKGECEKMAKITYQVVKIFLGNDSTLTSEWEGRFQSFDDWFKKQILTEEISRSVHLPTFV